MNDELDLYQSGGEIAPYSPVAPLSPSPDIGTDVDLFAGDSPQLFGTSVPSPEQAELVVLQIVSTFKNDAVKLGLSPSFTNAAINVFRQMANSPVPTERPAHGYNLSGLNISTEDKPYIDAFANQMKRLGADQESVRKALYWYTLLVQHLNGGQQHPQSQRQNEISDAEWARIVASNDRDIENCRYALCERWGRHQYAGNIKLVWDFFKSLPVSERERFLDYRLPSGVQGLNDPSTILWFFEQAIGGALPSGAALAAEIKSIEAKMGTQAYLKDEALQARYRALVTARDG